MIAELKDHERSKPTGMAYHSLVRTPGVLIADDMVLILTLLKFELESHGFKVWVAVDGNDALDLYMRHRDEIDLVLLDVQMPGLDGPHTLEAFQRVNPNIVACFMTGNAGNYTEEDLLGRGAAWCFSKPFRPMEVASILKRAVSLPDSTPFVCDWQTAPARMPVSRGLA